jgi:hypothetical protein
MNSKKNKNTKKVKSLKIQSIRIDTSFWKIIILPLLCILYCFYGILSNLFGNYIMDNSPKFTSGHITNEKYIIANTKIITDKSHTYGYEFQINNKIYTGNSHRRDLPVNYQVNIEYVSFFPYWNRLRQDNLVK